MFIWVWIDEVTPSKKPNSVLSTEPSCIKLAFNLLDESIVACLASSCVWALDDKLLINWNSVLVTLPSAILVASIAAAALMSALTILVIVLLSESIDLLVKVWVSVKVATVESIAISFALAVIPVPPTTFNVTSPDVPPPVNPSPATT